MRKGWSGAIVHLGIKELRSVWHDKVLLLFPEGTRSRTGEMGNFKPGAAALCISRDVPCLPVGIIGASDAMPRGASWPIKGRPPVYVVFGEPMRPEDGEKAADFSDRIAKEVRGLVDFGMAKGRIDLRVVVESDAGVEAVEETRFFGPF